jgi:hypothetical protein
LALFANSSLQLISALEGYISITAELESLEHAKMRNIIIATDTKNIIPWHCLIEFFEIIEIIDF